MTQRAIYLAIALGFASAPVSAESFRLAFSKSEQIEIFVEHAAGAAWCSPQLDMRVVYQADPDPNALATLMPKLGALLGQQCPQAESVQWRSEDAEGSLLARGMSSKASAWTLAITPSPDVMVAAAPEPASAPASDLEPTADTATPAATPEPDQAAATPVVAAPEPAPAPTTAAPASTSAASTAEASVPPALAEATAPTPVASETKLAPEAASAPEAAAPVARPEPEPAPAASEPAASATIASTPTAAPAPASDEPAPALETSAVAFDINGWKPQDDAQVREQAGFLSTMEDQNGCKIVSHFNLGDHAQYISLKSEGVTCGPDGYATGNGRLTLERSDGAVVSQLRDVWITAGIPFNQKLTQARLAATDGKQRLWVSLGQNAASQSYYLLRADLTHYHGGLGLFQIEPRVDVLTGNADAFRKADQIEMAILSALHALQEWAIPAAASSHLVFSSDFQEGTVNDQADHLLYAIRASRDTNWRTRQPVGEWKFNLQRGTNFVFRRDLRLAEEARRKAEQEAREERTRLVNAANNERQKLSRYETLVHNSRDNPQDMLAQLQSDVDYRLLAGGSYNRLAEGRSAPFRRIVQVSGSDGDDAKVNWPYDMRLTGQKSLKKQWYLIKGEVQLDAGRRDSEGLPLTLVSVSPDGVTPCAQDGCMEMTDPLTLARLQFGEPEWTPENAQAIIDQADQR